MCGRYFLQLSPERLQQIFGTETLAGFDVSPYITPLQTVPLIVRRRMGLARWGLLPDYAAEDDKTLSAKLKNARSETIMEKQTFSPLWQKGRRCLVPASGFYEWPEEKIKGHPPFKIYVQDEEAVAFAGLWTRREDLVTFSILTCAASPALSGIHSRMPVAFRPADALRWGEATPDQAYEMICRDRITNWTADLQEPLRTARKDAVPDLFSAA